MADKTYQIAESDVTQMHEKIHRHRRRIVGGVMLAAAILFAGLAGWYLYLQGRTYTKYDVRASAAREDTEGAQFVTFCGNVIRYG